MTIESKLTAELDEAESKAWDSLSRYKFQMFGYWSAIWVHLNRISGQSRPNPWKCLVQAAKQRSATPAESEPPSREDERKLCNCAGCDCEMYSEGVAGRIRGRPYCNACLSSDGSRGQSLASHLTPRQRAKLTHTGG